MSTIDERLDQVWRIKKLIARLEDDLANLLDQLTQDVAEGDLDATFSHNDATFSWSPGKVSYTYPQAVVNLSQQLKQAQAAAVADGTAAMKRGAPYWTVQLPKS